MKWLVQKRNKRGVVRNGKRRLLNWASILRDGIVGGKFGLIVEVGFT